MKRHFLEQDCSVDRPASNTLHKSAIRVIVETVAVAAFLDYLNSAPKPDRVIRMNSCLQFAFRVNPISLVPASPASVKW